MTYASGGLISASDYGNTSSNGFINSANQVNAVWGTGNGDQGYGQSQISIVNVGDTVTASQWATLYGTVNSLRKHQSGSGYTNMTLPVSGDVITYNSNLPTNITAANSNRALFASQGSTVVGTTNTWNITAGATSALNTHWDVNTVFTAGNNARYFFNSGGQINWVFSATDSANDNRSRAVRDLINNIGGISAFRNTTNGGRIGTGGTISINNTAFGYRNLVLNTETVLIEADAGAPYSGIIVKLGAFTDNSDTTNGSNGNKVILRLRVIAPADDVFGGAINVTVSAHLDYVYPESTYLTTNSWGTPSISYDHT